MVKVCFLSDLHTREVDPPDADLLVVCGDVTFTGRSKEVLWWKNWLLAQRSKYKEIIFIGGNHDFNADLWGPEVAAETNTIYLQDSGCEVLGLKIYGSPFTPTFGHWFFMADRGKEIRKIWNKIPKGLDILITHGPPWKTLDYADVCGHVGCWDLRDIVEKVKPRFHAYGHIHSSNGVLERNGTTFINAAICDEEYNPSQPPIVLEV